MNGGLAPLLLLAATIGVMLGLVAWRMALIAGPVFAGAAIAGFWLPVLVPQAFVFTGLFLTMITVGLLIYFPRELWLVAVIPIVIDAGLWFGACAALTSSASGLAIGLSPVLVALPASWISKRKFVILIKVVASWLIAIASLSLFVSLMPTPGYKPDHME